jgi:hypothetical protein
MEMPLRKKPFTLQHYRSTSSSSKETFKDFTNGMVPRIVHAEDY